MISDPNEWAGMAKDSMRQTIRLARKVEYLRGAIERIKTASLEGHICDDIAWFDNITTLHDYCEMILEKSQF